VKIEVNYHKV